MAKKSKKYSYNKTIAAILNFAVWGLGFCYANKCKRGILWLAAMVPFSLSCLLMGPEWMFGTKQGLLHILARIAISSILAYNIYKEKN